MPVSRVASLTNNTPANANDVSAEFNNLITGINANETAVSALASQTTYTGTRTFSNDVIVNGVLTANGGFLASQGGKPFSYESIPKPVQTPANLFEVKINGNIQATLFSPTAVAVPYFKQFTGSDLTIAINGTAGIAGSIDATRVSGQLYYLWLIGKDDGTLAGLFSASNTAPTMPAGYTWRRLLPWACATYPPIASYTNGSTAVTDITTSGREGAFIEHLVSNWGNNTVITYDSRFPSGVNINATNSPTAISYNKNYGASFAIENMACMNVTLTGQPMWLVPPEVEAVGLSIYGGVLQTLGFGVESFNGSGVFPATDNYAYYAIAGGTTHTPLLGITSRKIRVFANTGSSHLGVREFRCNFTNFWI